MPRFFLIVELILIALHRYSFFFSSFSIFYIFHMYIWIFLFFSNSRIPFNILHSILFFETFFFISFLSTDRTEREKKMKWNKISVLVWKKNWNEIYFFFLYLSLSQIFHLMMITSWRFGMCNLWLHFVLSLCLCVCLERWFGA